MFGRRNYPRALVGATASITVNEHHSEPCMIYDRSIGGVRVTLSNAEVVPEVFLLTVDATGELLICRAIWRNAEEIGAKAGPPLPDRNEIASLRR